MDFLLESRRYRHERCADFVVSIPFQCRAVFCSSPLAVKVHSMVLWGLSERVYHGFHGIVSARGWGHLGCLQRTSGNCRIFHAGRTSSKNIKCSQRDLGPTWGQHVPHFGPTGRVGQTWIHMWRPNASSGKQSALRVEQCSRCWVWAQFGASRQMGLSCTVLGGKFQLRAPWANSNPWHIDWAPCGGRPEPSWAQLGPALPTAPAMLKTFVFNAASYPFI